jgi:CheY-like chemotaxis protein/HPt (histidine-containing phosphotransfer) domain-containing protein/nitrogen-specific signal transduction histidine kinase
MTSLAPVQPVLPEPVVSAATADPQEATELARALDAARAELARTKSVAEALFEHLSHDLRIPMTVIIGASQLLLEGELEPVQREVLEAVQRSGKGLFSSLNEVLDYSRIEFGTLMLGRRDFELGACIRDACDALFREADSKGLRCRLDLEPELPHLARGDAGRFRQILESVLSDTIQFAKGGAVEVHVASRGSSEHLELDFRITDTAPTHGKLASMAALPLDPVKGRRFAPNGLGLVLAKRLIELMDGSFEVRALPAGGTCSRFSVRLERATNEPALAAHSGVVASSGLMARFRAPRARVLVAEDNDLNRVIVARALDVLDCKTDFAATGRQAVQAARVHEYDAVLMDCEMPDLDGFEATVEIRKLPGNSGRVPIIALTANAAPGDRERCLACGMDDYLSKPFSISDLRSKLKQYLGPDPVRASELEPSAPSGSEPPPIVPAPYAPVDFTRLEEIGSPELVEELTQIFMTDMADRLDALADAHVAGHTEELERGAHAIRGACGNFGARRMAELAEAIEHAPHGTVESTGAILAELRSEFERVREVLLARAV